MRSVECDRKRKLKCFHHVQQRKAWLSDCNVSRRGKGGMKADGI